MPTCKIVLLRHGIAEERETWKDRPDADRPLTPEGEKKLRRVAKAMRRLELDFDRIVSSPYERALRTAKIVREVAPFGAPLEVSPALVPDAEPGRALDEIAGEGAKGWHLWVGHEPHLSRLIERVAFAGRTPSGFEMRKGGLCCIAIEREASRIRGEFRWLLPPRLLFRIARV